MSLTEATARHENAADKFDHPDHALTTARGASSPTLLTVSLDPDTHERLGLAAALHDESPSAYLRQAVTEVIEDRLTDISAEEFRRQVSEALASPDLAADAPEMTARVAVRIDSADKKCLDLLATALRRSVASLVREGLQRVLERALGDKSSDQLRLELVDLYDGQRETLLRDKRTRAISTRR